MEPDPAVTIHLPRIDAVLLEPEVADHHVNLGECQSESASAVLTAGSWSVVPLGPLRLVSRGTAVAGTATAACVRSVWAPGLVAVAAVCRPARRWLTVAFVVPSLAGPWPAVALERCGDLAGSLGVWRGVIEQRTLRPLLPDWVGVDELLVDERSAAIRR